MCQNLNDTTLKAKYPWYFVLKSIFLQCGLFEVWRTHNYPNAKWLKLSIKQKLHDLFINKWFSYIKNFNKGLFYKIFKTNFGLEPYLKTHQPL